MYDGRRIFVVLPCYNVASHVGAVVAGAPPWVDGIIAVDDASQDETSRVRAAVDDPRLVIIRHERNRGVGGAMVTGFQKAATFDADVLVKVDGDGQMDFKHLPAL